MANTKKRNKIRLTPGEVVFNCINYLLLTLLMLICLYPLYQVVVDSISGPGAVMRSNGMLLWPRDVQFDAYKIVFSNPNLRTGFANTLFYMFFGTGFQFINICMAAYTLSKKNLMLKKGLMIYFTITMYIGGGIIPFFLLINKLGLMNSRWVLIIPFGYNVWDTIVMRTNFNNIPDGLREAAVIDGASDFTILLRVLMPLSGAVSAVILLWGAVGYWNMWFEPMIYLTERSKYPIQSILREILIDANAQLMAGSGQTTVKFDASDKSAANTLVKYANIVVCTVPILVVYPFAQKYFIKGVMIGSLKG